MRRLLALAIGIGVCWLLSIVVTSLDAFPESWNLGLREPLNEFKRWVVVNQSDHWLFVFFFDPLSAVIDFCIRRTEDLLLWLPWPVVIGLFFLLANRFGGLRLGLLMVI